jgi:Protein of Unknown function (DUF2784)
MIYRLLADAVLIVHLVFVALVVFGGLLVLRWPRFMWVHLPIVVWGVAIELIGFICPLTPLEVWLLEQGGEAGYEGGFINHYITSFLYPDGLTRRVQVLLGVLAFLPNVAIYSYLLLQRRHRLDRPRGSGSP